MKHLYNWQNSRRGGQDIKYQAPAIEYMYCDETAPLLDSPNAGFIGDEGGLEIEDLD